MIYKKIIIFGASSEIALSIVEEYKNECEQLILFSRDAESPILKKIISMDLQSKIIFYKTDVLELEQNLKIIDQFDNDISGLIWISGYTGDASSEYNDHTLLKKNLSINFFNPIIIINQIVKKMIKNKNSFLSVFTSVAGLRGRKKQLFYGSAKSGLITFLSGLRQKLSKDKIFVQTIIPGYMNTKPFREGNWKAPSFLITKPENVGKIVKKGINKRKDILYINIYWKFIMKIVNFIPEKIFKKLSF